jgi:hypothetical protein
MMRRRNVIVTCDFLVSIAIIALRSNYEVNAHRNERHLGCCEDQLMHEFSCTVQRIGSCILASSFYTEIT